MGLPPWHRPSLRRLGINLKTADFVKDASTEDQVEQADNLPAGAF